MTNRQGDGVSRREPIHPTENPDPTERFVRLLETVRSRAGVAQALRALPNHPRSFDAPPFTTRFLNGNAIYCQEGATLQKLRDDLTYAAQFGLKSFPVVRAFKLLPQDSYAVLVTTFEMGPSQALFRWKQWPHPLTDSARDSILRDIATLRKENLCASALVDSTADWWVVPSSGRVYVPDPRLQYILTTDTPLDQKIAKLPLSIGTPPTS